MNEARIVEKLVGDFVRTAQATVLPKDDRQRKLVAKIVDAMKQGRYEALKQYPQIVLEGLLEGGLLKLHLDKETKKYLKKIAGMIETYVGNLVKYSAPSTFDDPQDYDRAVELFKAL
jgi:hypothetical protein